MALSTNEIINFTTGIIHDYNLEEKHFNNLKEIFKMHGNQPFYVFPYISFIKNFLILPRVGSYTIEVPSRKENYFLNRLKDACFIQVIHRRTDKAALNSEYGDKIYFTIKIFR